ncbi:MAG TPA: neutral/alkaline non-lysosomal ceramidase N-terminal domain-containing protein [Coprothermobacter proteolyticus]|nr:neutral/alkaline non-lysosomal ceramidase N-terminal domain-containing protein [Coprothermobacter proteolyticus]
MIKYGYSQRTITLPLGIQMAGFLGERKAEGVHDDLYAKALYLEFAEHQKFFLIALDTLAISLDFSQAVASQLESHTGIPKDHILIAATHTHSGPEGLQSTKLLTPDGKVQAVGNIDSTLFEYTVEQTVNSALESMKDVKSGKLLFGECPFTQRVFGNRRELNTEELLPTFKMLILQGEDGSKALLYNFGCHPTVLHEQNHLISADFPGKVASLLTEQVNNLKFAMFFNGAAGDVSTRFYRQKSDFDEIERVAKVVQDSLIRCIPNTKEIDLDPDKFQAITIPVQLKIKEMPPMDVLRNMLRQAQEELQRARLRGEQNLRPWESKVEGIESLIRTSTAVNGAQLIQTALHILVFGEVSFVGVPGELFSTLGKQIEEALKPKKIFVVGYASDYIGYIPDMSAYDEGGYETLSTLLQRGEGERIVEIIIEALRNHHHS